MEANKAASVQRSRTFVCLCVCFCCLMVVVLWVMLNIDAAQKREKEAGEAWHGKVLVVIVMSPSMIVMDPLCSKVMNQACLLQGDEEAIEWSFFL